VGLCVWDRIGPEGRAEIISEARRSDEDPDFSKPFFYRADWTAKIRSCDPAFATHERASRLVAAAYAEVQATSALLAGVGVGQRRLESSWSVAPMQAWAGARAAAVALDEGWGRPPEARTWPTFFARLGLGAELDHTKQIWIERYFVARELQSRVVGKLARAPRRSLIFTPYTIVVGEIPAEAIEHPIWASLPTKDDLADVYPTSLLYRGEPTPEEFECLADADGSLGTCVTLQRGAPGGPYGGGQELIACCWRLAPLDADGKPVAGRKIRIKVEWASATAE
jgi:hypothetical protein